MLQGNAMEVAVIDINGMTCESCAQKIQSALSSLPGVLTADVDLSRNEANITFDSSRISISRLMTTVNQTGFEATGFTRGPADQPV